MTMLESEERTAQGIQLDWYGAQSAKISRLETVETLALNGELIARQNRM